ncbi:MAG: hypothetical protein Q8L85_09560 [Alphaproteobacteria bacterium]|nr:hypothetical protein [Alphaproteobacteria bacterium]
MRIISLIAISFAFVSIASAKDADIMVKLSDGKFTVSSAKSDGKDLSKEQMTELNTYFNSASEALKKAKTEGTATLGIFSGLLASFGL